MVRNVFTSYDLDGLYLCCFTVFRFIYYVEGDVSVRRTLDLRPLEITETPDPGKLEVYIS